MDILRIFIWFSIVGSILFMIKYWVHFKSNIHLLIPYLIIGVTFDFLLSAIYVTRELTLDEHIYILVSNVIEVVRNSFIAVVGFTLLNLGMEIKPLYYWEQWTEFVKELPIKFILIIVIGYALFSVTWFSIFVPGIFNNKIGGFYPFIAMLNVSILTALNEELFFRMFLIGLVIFFFNKWKYKWVLGIVLSTIIWSYSHWSFLDLGWIKFVHVFPLGVILGYTLKKYGFETCVFLHIVVNIVNILTAQVL